MGVSERFCRHTLVLPHRTHSECHSILTLVYSEKPSLLYPYTDQEVLGLSKSETDLHPTDSISPSACVRNFFFFFFL